MADPRTGATGLHRQPPAGLKLKAAADAAGKPIYLELSSVNPVVILPGALAERGAKIAEEFTEQLPAGERAILHQPGPGFVLAGKRAENFIGAT